MRIPRIYYEGELNNGMTVNLPATAVNHVARVLRLREGAPLTLFNGRGGEFESRITDICKREVLVEVTVFTEQEVESPLKVELAQGISKGERMDYTIQKAVELGVSVITPLETERSVVSLKGDRLEKKLRHWQNVIISACEQCGRNTLPTLNPVESLTSYLNRHSDKLKLLLDHRAPQGIGTVEISKGATLLIGPEGGLSAEERDAAIQAGYQAVRFGPRVLRTETAAVAALAVLQARMGDLG